MKKYIAISYIALLFSTFGGAIVLGAFVAPTIFGSGSPMAGEIMTNIFEKFGMFLNFPIVAILLFEGWKWKEGERDKIGFALFFITLSTALLFSHYYIPQIVEFQTAGETSSETFRNVHLASEIDFKIFSLAILFLGVRRFFK